MYYRTKKFFRHKKLYKMNTSAKNAPKAGSLGCYSVYTGLRGAAWGQLPASGTVLRIILYFVIIGMTYLNTAGRRSGLRTGGSSSGPPGTVFNRLNQLYLLNRARHTYVLTKRACWLNKKCTGFVLVGFCRPREHWQPSPPSLSQCFLLLFVNRR